VTPYNFNVGMLTVSTVKDVMRWCAPTAGSWTSQTGTSHRAEILAALKGRSNEGSFDTRAKPLGQWAGEHTKVAAHPVTRTVHFVGVRFPPPSSSTCCNTSSTACRVEERHDERRMTRVCLLDHLRNRSEPAQRIALPAVPGPSSSPLELLSLIAMTQFTDKSAKDGEETARAGLFTYPVLMGARHTALGSGCRHDQARSHSRHAGLAPCSSRRLLRSAGQVQLCSGRLGAELSESFVLSEFAGDSSG
jgi:hypothetical protein